MEAVGYRATTTRTRGSLRRLTLRTACASDAPTIHALIMANLREGRLLPRSLDNLVAHAPRFVVAIRSRTVVGCAELAPLSRDVAEVRSLVVAEGLRGRGVGARLVDELGQRARTGGFETLCVFTHAPAYFASMNFSIVPHSWLPDKVHTDCVACPLFRSCGQFAMTMSLEPIGDAAAIARVADPRL